jgi:mono/diheme cytochrome c family protein
MILGVINRGRPAKGMPTWGTVLSPSQIEDVVVLLAAWREGLTVEAGIPLATFVTNALYAIRDFDHPDAVFYLKEAQSLVQGSQEEEIQAIIDLVDENQLFNAEARLIALLPPEEMGEAAFKKSCSPCHGDDGTGGMGPNLHSNSFIQSSDDEILFKLILEGRRGTAMNGLEGVLGNDEIGNIILLLREWQK